MLIRMRFDTRAAAPALAILLAAGALLASAALSGCASRPPALVPEPRLSLAAWPAELLDQNRARLRFEAILRNPRAQALIIESSECELAFDGAVAPLAAKPVGPAAPATPGRIEAEGSASFAFECLVDLRDLGAAVIGPDGPAEISFSAAARLRLRSPEGSVFEPAAAASGSIPIVREPEIRITSLRVERDVLVTSNLRLGIEIRNPNAFPIELRRLSYAFYGEGRKWTAGSESEAFAVPARSSSEIGLVFEMNFADVDRRLFDLVAKLGTIGYRLSGSSRVVTGIEELPSFKLAFKLEGACPVER